MTTSEKSIRFHGDLKRVNDFAERRRDPTPPTTPIPAQPEPQPETESVLGAMPNLPTEP